MANAYIYNLTDSWTNASAQYTGLGMDVTDGGSTANSALMSLSLAGTVRFKVGKAGNVYVSNTFSVNTTNTSYAAQFKGDLLVVNATTNTAYFAPNGNFGVGTGTPTYKIDNRGGLRSYGYRADVVAGATPTVTTSASGGTVPANTYYFKVTSLDVFGNQSLPATEVSNTTTGSTSTINLSWTAPTGSAASYRVWIGTAANTYTSYFAATNANLSITALTGNVAGTIPVHDLTGSTYVPTALGVGTSPVTTSKVSITATDVTDTSYNAVRNSVTLSNVSISANTNKTGMFTTVTSQSLQKNANGTSYTGSVATAVQAVTYNGSSATGGDGTIGIAYGMLSQVQNWANGATANSISTAYGVYSSVAPIKGPILSAIGIQGIVTQSNSTYANITNGYGVQSIINGNNTGGASINAGFLYYGQYQNAVATNAHGMYIIGETKNYFSGNVGIGVTIPTAKLHVSGNATVTSNTLLLGTSSVAAGANGYTWLPNNIKLNFGWVQANSSTGNATFSNAFATACLAIHVTGLSGTSNVAYVEGSPNTTVAVIRTTSATAANVSYIAIGI